MASNRSAATGQRRKQSTHQRKNVQRKQPIGKLLRFPQFQRRFKMKKRTLANVGALTIGAVGVTLANLVGVGEIIIGTVAAYATYRVIRYGVTPTEALIEGVEIEHGEHEQESKQPTNAI